MVKYFLIIFILFLFQPIVFSQQIQLSENPFVYSYTHPSPAFANNFMYDQHLSFSLRNTDDYKKQRVKQVEVYALYYDNEALRYRVVLDTAGIILETRTKGMRYMISYREDRTIENQTTQIRKYYEGEEWIRTDSTIQEFRNYIHGDTTMHYQKLTTYKYYKGSLLNTQNAYYNENYLNVEIHPEAYPPLVHFWVDEIESSVYLTHALPTDFEEDSIYAYSEELISYNYYGGIKDQDFTLEIAKDHPFMKSYATDNSSEYFVSGAEFIEPRWQEESMWCGNSLYSQQHYYDGRVSGTSYLDNGLISEIWEDYYPEDPNPKPREVEENEDPNVLRIEDVYEGWVPRLDTAVRTIKYRFDYEYF